MLEKSPWLSHILPWGPMSKYDDLEPCESDDGPILWTCPGEQTVPTSELSGQEGVKKKRTILDRLSTSRIEKPREKLIMDRTG